MRFSKFLLLAITSAATTTVHARSPLGTVRSLASEIQTRTRRALNFSDLFGSPTSVPSYDRISSQPVFCVTTPWGSPYLLFERRDKTDSSIEYDDVNEDEFEPDVVDAGKSRASREKGEKSHQVALYFLDEQDAMTLRDEMLQVDQMKGMDMRITAMSLGKALRQASNLNKGLLTGQPLNDHTGRMKTPDEGGVLRYKIVPPKRELFYAARCSGKERVGLFSEKPADDANLMLNDFPVIGAYLLNERRKALDRRNKAARARARGKEVKEDEGLTKVRKDYAHMEGFLGIPVFHSPSLKKYNAIKGAIKNDKRKVTPLFFSYEDLLESWKDVRNKLKTDEERQAMPEEPEVEVYNVMDIVTSIDKDRWNTERALQLRRKEAGFVGQIPILNRILVKKDMTPNSGLQDVVFVPNSKNTKFKELLSKVGNSKARGLRPMKPWGRDAM